MSIASWFSFWSNGWSCLFVTEFLNAVWASKIVLSVYYPVFSWYWVSELQHQLMYLLKYLGVSLFPVWRMPLTFMADTNLFVSVNYKQFILSCWDKTGGKRVLFRITSECIKKDHSSNSSLWNHLFIASGQFIKYHPIAELMMGRWIGGYFAEISKRVKCSSNIKAHPTRVALRWIRSWIGTSS